MRKLVNKIFRKYGVTVQLQGSSGVSILHGFVQHTATSARRNLLPEHISLGAIPQGHYLMLLPVTSVRVDDLLMYNGKWYIVRRVERVWMGDEAIYDWCLCEERGEDDQWGS